MFDLRTKVMIGIACGLLVAAILLINVVLCLYFKISKALKSAKQADVISCTQPCKVIPSKRIRPKPVFTESCRTIQCYDACSIYTDVGALPPCYCDGSEGL